MQIVNTGPIRAPKPPPPLHPRTTAECAARLTRADIESVIRGQLLDAVNAQAIRSLFPRLYPNAR
jgi:hypothetical protein